MSHTLTSAASHETLVKRSRFIAHAAPCADESSARAFIDQVRDETASHHCWAFKCGQLYRFDDDGEPGGTAGRPILQAIEGQDLDRVVVVVIRHFGGVKLGTGGLIRAYGGTAAECLRQAPVEAVIVMTRLQCRLPFDSIAMAHQLFERHAATKLKEHYVSAGIDLTLELPDTHRDALIADLNNATSGQAEIHSARDCQTP